MYQVWFSGGAGTGIYVGNQLVEWYVCFQGDKEECEKYIKQHDHSTANWRIGLK